MNVFPEPDVDVSETPVPAVVELMPWVTPEATEFSVTEVTQAATGEGADLGIYS